MVMGMLYRPWSSLYRAGGPSWVGLHRTLRANLHDDRTCSKRYGGYVAYSDASTHIHAIPCGGSVKTRHRGFRHMPLGRGLRWAVTWLSALA
jgi:hypothetical protein